MMANHTCTSESNVPFHLHTTGQELIDYKDDPPGNNNMVQLKLAECLAENIVSLQKSFLFMHESLRSTTKELEMYCIQSCKLQKQVEQLLKQVETKHYKHEAYHEHDEAIVSSKHLNSSIFLSKNANQNTERKAISKMHTHPCREHKVGSNREDQMPEKNDNKEKKYDNKKGLVDNGDSSFAQVSEFRCKEVQNQLPATYVAWRQGQVLKRGRKWGWKMSTFRKLKVETFPSTQTGTFRNGKQRLLEVSRYRPKLLQPWPL